jgi:WD40 repeat protein
LAVGCVTNNAQLIDASTGSLKRTFQTRSEIVHLLKFSPDGHGLVIGSLAHEFDPGDTRVWSLDQEGSLDLGNSTSGVSFSSDCRQLLVNDRTGTIRLWDLTQRAEVERFSARAISAQFLPDGRIFSPGLDGRISIYQTRESGMVQLKGYPNALRTLAFSPDNQWLVAAGMDRKVFVWNAPGGQLAGIYTNHLERAPAVAFSPDGRVATASLDSGLQLWDPASRRMIWQTALRPASDAYWLVFSPDGRRLYAASQTQTTTVLDAMTGKRLNAINGLATLVDGLAISPDGRLLAICEKVKLSAWLADGSRKLWETPADPERCAAFSPDGKWIATGDHDGAVTLWEVASAGRVRRTLKGHTGAVSGVSFHPDGSRLVSSSFDGQVKLWELKSGVELLSIPLPGGINVWHALFSPDGKAVAAAGGDGIVTLFKTQ